MNARPPWETGQPARGVDLKGYLVPWADGHPLLLAMTGTDSEYVPCFSTLSKLESSLRSLGLHCNSIKQISDDGEFLASLVLGGVEVIVDPWRTPEGKVRFHHVRFA